MSRTLSLVAGGTAAVVLLGITTSFAFREPAPSPGALGGPVVVEVPPLVDPPAVADAAPAGAPAAEPSTSSAPLSPPAGYSSPDPASPVEPVEPVGPADVTGPGGTTAGKPEADETSTAREADAADARTSGVEGGLDGSWDHRGRRTGSTERTRR